MFEKVSERFRWRWYARVPAWVGASVLFLSAAAGEERADPVQGRFLAPGIAQVEIEDPEGLWRADGIEVDLQDSGVEVDTAFARRSVLGRETVSQVALRRKKPRQWLAGVAGCDSPAEQGLPRGLLVRYDGLLSVPVDGHSFAITRSGVPFLGRFEWEMWYETSSGERITIDRFNRRPGPGETALFSADYGERTGTEGNVTELTLDLYDPYLNPTGETRVRVGDISTGLGDQAIPRLGFVLTVPVEVYEEHVVGFAVQAPGKLHCRLECPDGPDAVRRELGLVEDGVTWPSRLFLAVSGGARILREGRIALEGAPEGEEKPAVTRTALGLNPGWGVLWVVVVKPTAASRVNRLDAARCLVLLGATDGMLLAGGDHSPLRIRDEVINPPVSSELEVPIADALLVYSKSREPGLTALEVEPGGKVYLPVRGEVDFEVRALDRTGKEIPVRKEEIEVELSGETGEMEGFRFTAGRRTGDSSLTFRTSAGAGGRFTDTGTVVKVSVRKPKRLVVAPSPVILDPGERVDLDAELHDREGFSLRFPAEEVEWTLQGVEGTVSPDGSLIVTGRSVGWAEGRYRQWHARVPVYVGALRVVTLDPMDNVGEWEPGPADFGGARFDFRPLQGMVQGSRAFLLAYEFADQRMTQRLSLSRELPVGGEPYGFRLRVYGDGSGLRLSALVRDARGRLFRVPFRDAITWQGSWREIDAPMELASPIRGDPGREPRFPVTFQGLALVREMGSPVVRGRIGLGKLSLLYLDEDL